MANENSLLHRTMLLAVEGSVVLASGTYALVEKNKIAAVDNNGDKTEDRL